MKKKKNARKLSLAKETLTALDPQNLEPVVGAVICAQESAQICSEVHTCVSCQNTWD
jgi:hypothetical protein